MNRRTAATTAMSGTGCQRARESRNGWIGQEEQGGVREQRHTDEKTGPEGGLSERQRVHRPGTGDPGSENQHKVTLLQS